MVEGIHSLVDARAASSKCGGDLGAQPVDGGVGPRCRRASHLPSIRTWIPERDAAPHAIPRGGEHLPLQVQGVVHRASADALTGWVSSALWSQEKIARKRAGCVALALAETRWTSFAPSTKVCPAL